jgi:hypothetical protein
LEPQGEGLPEPGRENTRRIQGYSLLKRTLHKLSTRETPLDVSLSPCSAHNILNVLKYAMSLDFANPKTQAPKIKLTGEQILPLGDLLRCTTLQNLPSLIGRLSSPFSIFYL